MCFKYQNCNDNRNFKEDILQPQVSVPKGKQVLYLLVRGNTDL